MSYELLFRLWPVCACRRLTSERCHLR